MLLFRRNDSFYLQNRFIRKVNVMNKRVKMVNRCTTLQKESELKDASFVKFKIKILDDITAFTPESQM